jgi:hypothetical protein
MLRRTSVSGSRRGSRSVKQSGHKLAQKPFCKPVVANRGNGRLERSRHLAQVLVQRRFWIAGNTEVGRTAGYFRIARLFIQNPVNERIALISSTHNEDPPCGHWSVTGGIRLPFLPTRWSATHTPNPSNSRRVRAAAYSSRIAVTGFRRIARCAGR